MHRVYDQFLNRIEIGRGKRLERKTPNIADVAQGRLFTGRQALANGLVDRLGGVNDAIRDLAKELKLKEGQYDVVDYPEPMTLPEYLKTVFGADANVPSLSADQLALIQTARMLMGPAAWQQATQVMSGIMLLRREPVLLLMPAVIKVR